MGKINGGVLFEISWLTVLNIKHMLSFPSGMKPTHLWNVVSASPGRHLSDNIDIAALLESYSLNSKLPRNTIYFHFHLYQNNPYYVKDLQLSVMLWRKLCLLVSGCCFYYHSIAMDTQIYLLASFLLKSPVKNRIFPVDVVQNQVQTMRAMSQRGVLIGAPCRAGWSAVGLQEFLMCFAAAEIMLVCVLSFNRFSGIQEGNSE